VGYVFLWINTSSITLCFRWSRWGKEHIKTEIKWCLIICNFVIFPLISMSDIFSINKLTLILKIISQNNTLWCYR
jgi:hypothetical protein